MASGALFVGRLAGFAIAVVTVAIVTLGFFALRDHVNQTTIALVFLLLVVAIATLYESKTALAASILAAFSLNFFFLPPYHTLNIAEVQNWIALLVFLAVAITVGHLSSMVNRRRAEAVRLYKEREEAFEKASEAEALKRSGKLKTALLDAVTHDLRTPLTSLKASVTMLIEDSYQGKSHSPLDSAGKAELLEVINEETDRLNSLVESMIELARIESGVKHWIRSEVLPQEIIIKAARAAKRIRATHNLKSKVEPELPALSLDSRALIEAFLNLLDNAAKYSLPGTTITIGAYQAGGAVRFFVEDEGLGVPESQRERIFERYSRNSGSAGGLGLGLAIVRGIVEGHEGRIWVESGVKGARFVFDLPATVDGRETENTGR